MRWAWRDHPRVCGEKQRVWMHALYMAGSPPRMRGKERRNHGTHVHGGITPAYAGKSCPCRITSLACRDHPRVCGEKSAGGHSVCGILGSPPRMRGKGILGAVNKSNIGITPAYAGKRDTTTARRASPWDHPRVCGKKGSGSCRKACGVGLPPRMRGKASVTAPYQPSARITPAYAGKSTRGHDAGKPAQDHPRICGEKYPVMDDAFIDMGSPPRVRGKVPCPVFGCFC